MNKKLKAGLLASLMVLPMSISASAKTFTDSNGKYETAIDELSELGIVDGFDDGTFRPTDTLTRAQFTKMVVSLLNEESSALGHTSSAFADVPSYNWASPYIAYAYEQGIVNGVDAVNNLFDPDSPVTYMQAKKMLVSAAGYGAWATDNGGWPDAYMNYANEVGIVADESIEDNAPITRGVCAELLAKTLTAPICKVVGYEVNVEESEKVITPCRMKFDGSDDTPYQSILTDNHYSFEVYGTAQKAADGTVSYTMTETKNYNDSEVVLANGDTPVTIEGIKDEASSTESMLDKSTRAIIHIEDESQPPSLVYITADNR